MLLLPIGYIVPKCRLVFYPFGHAYIPVAPLCNMIAYHYYIQWMTIGSHTTIKI